MLLINFNRTILYLIVYYKNIKCWILQSYEREWHPFYRNWYFSVLIFQSAMNYHIFCCTLLYNLYLQQGNVCKFLLPRAWPRYHADSWQLSQRVVIENCKLIDVDAKRKTEDIAEGITRLEIIRASTRARNCKVRKLNISVGTL